MAQLELCLQVPGTGGLRPVGKITHDPSLGSSKLHGFQRVGHGLVGTPVQYPGQMSVVVIQKKHLPDKNVARYVLF